MAGFINSFGICGMLCRCLVGLVECMSTGPPSGKWWQVKVPLTRPPIRIFKKKNWQDYDDRDL